MTPNILRFVLDNRLVEIDFSNSVFRPSTTLLNYLRSLPQHRGTKEGCGEGDCGACTVVLGELSEKNRIQYRAVNSCMVFLPSIHGKQVITIENLALQNGSSTALHPVQQAIVNEHGSQCGFCTPGIVMSLFAFYKSNLEATRDNIIASLAGNLCRCTGYEPIIKATQVVSNNRQSDHFDENEALVVGLLSKIRSRGESLEINHSKQRYFLPKSLNQALEIRSKYPEAYVVNGATDTAINQNKKFEFLNSILDISAIDELKTIQTQPPGFLIGAGVSIESVKEFSKNSFPALTQILTLFASLQIRNTATIGGNLCNASPIGDLIPIMFALRAKLKIASTNSARWVDAEDFITGYRKNCLQSNELLEGILIPLPDEGIIIKAEKVSTRRDLDISTVSLATRVELDRNSLIKDILLAYGGLAEKTKRATKTENFLIGKEWSLKSLEEAKKLIAADFSPISDARACNEYRTVVAGNLLIKIFVD